MIKYIITSGTSVINMYSEDSEGIEITPSNKRGPVKFDKIGEAMLAASKINKLMGSPIYRVMSIEI